MTTNTNYTVLVFAGMFIMFGWGVMVGAIVKDSSALIAGLLIIGASVIAMLVALALEHWYSVRRTRSDG